MAVPNYLGFAKQPGVLQTAVSTAGVLQNQAAQREKMGLAGQAEQRAEAGEQRTEALAPFVLQTARQTAQEQPVKFHSALANDVSTRHLKAAQAAKAGKTDPATFKGAAGDAVSLQMTKEKYGENSEIYKNALDGFQANINLKKKRASYFGANVWKKNQTTLQKTQFNQDFQNENIARQAKGLAPLGEEQFAVLSGYKQSDQQSKADAISASVDDVQLNQVKNGKPITPADKILHHVIKGGDATKLPGAHDPTQPPPPAGEVQQPILPPQQGGLAPQQMPQGQASQQGEQVPQGQQVASGAGQQAGQIPPQGQQTAPPPASGTAQPSPGLLTTPKYREQAGQTGLSTLRQTSDAQNRGKILFGNQSLITIGQMLPDLNAMLSYTGPAGTAQLKADAAIFQHVGKGPPAYEAYKRFTTNAHVLNDQITQYFGKSITPTAREELDEMTNPRNWLDEPGPTREAFNAFHKTLIAELNARKKALKSPDEYYSETKAGPKTYTDDAYQSTAKKYGMTVPQLKKYIASKKGK